jgi:GAF domain-containing protein
LDPRRKLKSQRPGSRSSRPVPSTKTSSVRRRRDLVAEVTRTVATIDSMEGTLARVARVCVPELAEMSCVDVLRESGDVERVEAVHVDPSKAEAMRVIKGQLLPRDRHPVMEVIASGRPLLTREVDDAMLGRIARDPAHLVLLRRFGPKSQMRLPVILGGRPVAVMTFTITDSARRFDAQDLELAERIVARVAAALER